MAEPSARTLRVALAGGVGTGKSAVGVRLQSFGAYRMDADQLARDVVEPGTDGLAEVITRFGPTIQAVDGTLDRTALAALVFTDSRARADLNALLHPRVAELSRGLMAAAPLGSIVVYEIPLLTEDRSRADFDVIVVVEAPLSVRLARLAGRGLDEKSARARIAAQVSAEELRSLADEIVDNSGSEADLDVAAAALWARLQVRQGTVS